jgi:hypothetical protein
VLVDKSLVKIYHWGVWLHDLIEDMGKEIVQKESPDHPEKRTRLWFHKDIVEVLEENKVRLMIFLFGLIFVIKSYWFVSLNIM